MTQTGRDYSVSYRFEPKGDLQDLAEHFDQTPHYLFRTYAPKSNGCSTEIDIKSAAVCSGKDDRDLFSLDRETAASMLDGHTWKNLESDNLMSWTSSSLFAVQHGIYRKATDFGSPNLSVIRICVLDTRKVDRGSFLPAVALLKAYGIPSTGKLRHEYYHGEYLSQGTLEVWHKSASTSLEALICRGLHDLFPPFADESTKGSLYNRVL